MNRPAAGQVILRGGQLEIAIGVTHRNQVLNTALTEAPFADDQRSVMIFQRARDDLGGARTAAVHQDDQRQLAVAIFGSRRLGISGQPSPLGAHDAVAIGQEHLRHFDRGLQQSTRVETQIQDQAAHALLLEMLQRVFQLADRRVLKVRQADVADLEIGIEHEIPLLRLRTASIAFHTLNLDLFAHQRDIERFLRARTIDRQHNFGAGWSHDRPYGSGQTHAFGGLPVHMGDHIIGLDAGAIGGRAFERSHHRQLVLQPTDLNAYSDKPSLGVLLKLGVLNRPDHRREFVQRTVRTQDFLEELVDDQLPVQLHRLIVDIQHFLERGLEILVGIILQGIHPLDLPIEAPHVHSSIVFIFQARVHLDENFALRQQA